MSENETLVAYQLRAMRADLEKLNDKLDARFRADDAAKLDTALRIDRLEQRQALAWKVIGAVGLAVLGLAFDALRALF